MSEDEDYIEDHDEIRYPAMCNIDFTHIQQLLGGLILFDDVFLNMQAININMVDTFITDCEYSLLREYIEIEKTPVDTAMFVSAQSQMWIFALYELLRTWRGKVWNLQKLHKNGGLKIYIKNLEKGESLPDLSTSIRKRHAEKALKDPEFLKLAEKHLALVEHIFTLTSDVRVNLAKHERPGKENKFPRAPGYGRINMWCGAMDYEIERGDGMIHFLNRRDIADAMRVIPLDDLKKL